MTDGNRTYLLDTKFGIDYIDTFDMLRQLEARFQWEHH